MQKGQGSSSGGSLASSFASRFGAAASGATSTAGSTSGGSASRLRGLFGGGGAAGGGATIGTVSSIDGRTLYVSELSGNTVAVVTTPESKITKSESVGAKAIHPGDSVVIEGLAGSKGTITASSVTDSGSSSTGTERRARVAVRRQLNEQLELVRRQQPVRKIAAKTRHPRTRKGASMTADRPRFRARAAAATGIALLAAAALAACGGSSSGAGTNPSASTTTPASATGASGTANTAASRTALEKCLKSHGVAVPTFAGRPGGFGASGRFGTTGGFGPSGRFGASGRAGAGAFFRRLGASGRFGSTGASGPGGFLAGNSKRAAAFKACGVDFGRGFGGGFARPGAAAGGGFNVNTAAGRAAVTRFVACVRRHGYDIPNPNLSGTGPVYTSTEVNRSNPKFISASNACASLLRS